MTLLEMLDTLEVGCGALKQKNIELAAALDQVSASTGAVLTLVPEPAKKRAPAKPKRKPAKKAAKTKKAAKGKAKKAVPAPSISEPEPKTAPPANAPNKEHEPKVGKRQALGMSFTKLLSSIQARRAGQREMENEGSGE